MRIRSLAFAFVLAAACQHSSNTSTDAPAGADAPTITDAPGPRRPNIVFILTDDLNVEVYSHMPRLKQMMDSQGLSFQAHFLNISLCCPSRTAILRGQYAHNTKIYTNSPPTGGFETFYANHSEAETFPVWLQAAGYKTVLMGKYLNGYPNTASSSVYIPPGWTEWYSPVDGNPYGELKYQMNENGTVVRYGDDGTDNDYLVDVLSNKAADFIHRNASQPFFMYVAPYAPHSPATPPTRYKYDFPGAKAPRTQSFQEADMSDKPSWLASKPPLTQAQVDNLDQLYGKRLRSMEAVEDLVQHVVDQLTADNLLDNTYIVFTSDNGFHQGQHRLNNGKNTEFDEDLRVPLIVRGPGVPAGATIDAPTLNIDFAPTFLELAGAAIPPTVDGRSLVPLLAGTQPAGWRQVVYLEHKDDTSDEMFLMQMQHRAPIGTMEPLDYDPGANPASGGPGESGPPFEGVRTAKYTYVEYDSGEIELYDHDADPDQLNNIGMTTTNVQLLTKLHALVQGMHGCNGEPCRTADAQDAP